MHVCKGPLIFKLPKETKIVWRSQGGGGVSSSYQEIRKMGSWINRN